MIFNIWNSRENGQLILSILSTHEIAPAAQPQRVCGLGAHAIDGIGQNEEFQQKTAKIALESENWMIGIIMAFLCVSDFSFAILII